MIKKIIIVILVVLIFYLIFRTKDNFFIETRLEFEIDSEEAGMGTENRGYNVGAPLGLWKEHAPYNAPDDAIRQKLAGQYAQQIESEIKYEGGRMVEVTRLVNPDPSPVANPNLISRANDTVDVSETHIKTDEMNLKGQINQSLINLDPNAGDDKHINVGNDIIVKKNFRVKGYDYPITIPFLRYLKHLPLHFEEKICLGDSDTCINKKHVEVVKGERRINLKTYPENFRKCLGAKVINHKPHLFFGARNIYTFGDQECTNGDPRIEFVITRDKHAHPEDREVDDLGRKEDTHVHQHIIQDISHDHLD